MLLQKGAYYTVGHSRRFIAVGLCWLHSNFKILQCCDTHEENSNEMPRNIKNF